MIDRRLIFVLVFLAVLIPLIFPLNFPMEVTRPARMVYEAIEKLPPGSNVLVSFDYRPSSSPECHPMALGIIKHCFQKDLNIVAIALIPDGASFIVDAFKILAPKYNKRYGIDYVNLGYKSGGFVVVQKMGIDLPSTFPTDINGEPISKFPLMQEIKNYDDFSLLIDISDTSTVDLYYIAIAKAQYHIEIVGGVTAVVAPLLYAYLDSGQLSGLLGGLKGAAEYEKLLNYSGFATAGMDAQSAVHLLIVIMIIISNVLFFLSKKKTK